MKKKMLAILIVAATVMLIGCGSKKDPVEIQVETEKEAKIDDENKRLEELDNMLPVAREYFETAEIVEDSYINFEGKAYKFVYVYDSWTPEEFDAFKEKAVEIGKFTATNYEYNTDGDGHHFAARTADEKYYFAMGEVKNQGRKCVTISVSEE